jgi:hypothetical protein
LTTGSNSGDRRRVRWQTRTAVSFFDVRTDRSAGTENLVRKVTRDRPACVQKLRHANDLAGEQQKSFVDIEGFSRRREFVCSKSKQTKSPLLNLSIEH